MLSFTEQKIVTQVKISDLQWEKTTTMHYSENCLRIKSPSPSRKKPSQKNEIIKSLLENTPVSSPPPKIKSNRIGREKTKCSINLFSGIILFIY